MDKPKSVLNQAKPDAAPPRRRCLDIEYRRRHGCADKWDLVLIATSVGLAMFSLGLTIGLNAVV